jgi:CHAD domain-containing protein
MSRATPRDATELLTRRANALRRHFARAVEGEPSGVHQCRVASRRLREAVPVLTAGRHALGRSKTRRRLRQLTRSLGAIRELDVTIDLIHELARRDQLPAHALDDVRAHVEQERARQCGQQMKGLARVDARRLVRRLDELAEAMRTGASDTWHKALATRLVSRGKKLSRAAAQAGHLYEPDRLHRIRIAVKKLRYTLELARESGVPAAQAPVRRLRAIQDVLGRLHDFQVLQIQVSAVQAQRRPHGNDDLAVIARRLEDDCRHLHAKYLSMAPAVETIARETRAIAAGLAPHRRRRPLKATLDARPRDGRQPRAAGA